MGRWVRRPRRREREGAVTSCWSNPFFSSAGRAAMADHEALVDRGEPRPLGHPCAEMSLPDGTETLKLPPIQGLLLGHVFCDIRS